MASLIVLGVSVVVFKVLGVVGVGAFADWENIVRYALALMFIFTGVNHFTRMKYELVKMVPNLFPRPMTIIYLTGAFELLGAVGLLINAVQLWAGIGLLLLLVAMFPANIKAAWSKVLLRGRPATPLWLRVPMQILYIGLVGWLTLVALA